MNRRLDLLAMETPARPEPFRRAPHPPAARRPGAPDPLPARRPHRPPGNPRRPARRGVGGRLLRTSHPPRTRRPGRCPQALEGRRNPREEITLDGLDEIANDTDYLVEWNASASQAPHPEPQPPALHPGPPPWAVAAEIVTRHAALEGEPPPALLATLRRGETIDPDGARELLQALIDLERTLNDETAIGRRLAFALHRLAFEGQILITDGFPHLGGDPPTVETLRLVQEAVDRVLSGEDIRYNTQPNDETSDRPPSGESS